MKVKSRGVDTAEKSKSTPRRSPEADLLFENGDCFDDPSTGVSNAPASSSTSPPGGGAANAGPNCNTETKPSTDDRCNRSPSKGSNNSKSAVEIIDVGAHFDKFMALNAGIESNEDRWLARFNLSVGLVIFINSIVIAVQTDHKPETDAQESVYEGIEHFFVSFFVLEFFIRLKLEMLAYFKSAWNLLDFLCVVGSVLDVWLLPIVYTGDTSGLRSLSILRVIRLLRVVRLLRLFKMFRDLYVILSSFAASLRSIFWVTILMGLGNFFCSILVTQMVGQNSLFADIQIGDDGISERFGSVPRSMYSLFELLMLEGWNEVGRPLIERSPWLILFFICFFMIFTFGLLNMIVGMVVEQTIEQSKANDHRIQKEAEKELKRVILGLKDFFLAVDKDGNGELSFEEFEEAVQGSPEVLHILEQNEIPADQWEDLFRILDADGNGRLTVEEFLGGILRVRGTARNRDLVATHMTVTRLLHQQNGLLTEVMDVKRARELTSERLAAIEAIITGCIMPEEPKATQPLGGLSPRQRHPQAAIPVNVQVAENTTPRAIEPD